MTLLIDYSNFYRPSSFEIHESPRQPLYSAWQKHYEELYEKEADETITLEETLLDSSEIPEFLRQLLYKAWQNHYEELYEKEADETITLEETLLGILDILEDKDNLLYHDRYVCMAITLALAVEPTVKAYLPNDKKIEQVFTLVTNWFENQELPTEETINNLFSQESLGSQAIDEALDVFKNLLQVLNPTKAKEALLEILDDCLEGYAIFPGSKERRDLFDWWLLEVVPATWCLKFPEFLYTIKGIVTLNLKTLPNKLSNIFDDYKNKEIVKMNNSYQQAGRSLFTQLDIDFDDIIFEQLSNYTAVEFFLTVEDEPPFDATNLEKANRYLESFHHLCEVEDWKRASEVTFFQLNPSNPNKEIHNYLFDWGYLQETVNICEPLLGKLAPEKEAILISSISHAYDQLGKYEEVIDLQPKLRGIAQQIKRPDFEAAALNSLGHVYQSLGQYQRAIEYHEAAMRIAIELKNKERISGSLNNLGNAYFFLQEYEKALQFYQQYLSLGRELNNKEKESGALFGIANCYRDMGQYQDSILHYEQSLTIAEDFGYRKLKASIQGGLGVSLKNIGEYKKAIDCYTKSLSLVREIGERQGEATVLGNLGVTYRLLNEYQTAISYQEKAIAICSAIGDKHGEGRAYINLGNVYQENNDINRAFLNWIRGIFIFHDLKIQPIVKQLLNNYFSSLVSMISQFSKDENINREIEIINLSQIYIEEMTKITNLDIKQLNTDLKCSAIEEIVKIISYYFK